MPAYPSGTVEQQVLQQYSYLFQMAQQLNLALEAAESSRTAAVQAAGKSRAAQGTEQEYQNLKSLIIKTADTVQRLSVSGQTVALALKQNHARLDAVCKQGAVQAVGLGHRAAVIFK